MSNVLGPAFVFLEWKTIIANSPDESKWAPALEPEKGGGPQTLHQAVAAKWVYLFQNDAGRVKWYGEYYVDDGIGPVDLTEHREHERELRRPSETRVAALSLPHTVNGTQVFYYAYISRIQLHLAKIRELEDRAEELLFPMDASLPKVVNDYGNPNQLWYDTTWFYRAVDPLTITHNLGQKYRNASDDVIGYSGFYDGQPDAQKRQVQDRLCKLAISKQLIAAMDSTGGDAAAVRSQLSATGEADMRQYVEDYERQNEAKKAEAERRGAQLAQWLSGGLWEFAVSAHEVDVEADMPVLLKVWGLALTRLSETLPGISYLVKQVEDESSLVRKYALRKSVAPTNIFRAGRRAADGVIRAWGQAAKILVGEEKIEPKTAAEEAAAGLKNISQEDLVTVRQVDVASEMPDGNQNFSGLKKSVTVMEENPAANWGRWLVEHQQAAEVRQMLSDGLKVMAYMLTLAAIVDADNPWTVKNGLRMLSAVCSTPGIVESVGLVPLSKLYKFPMGVVGGISSGIDLIGAELDAIDAYGKNDYSAMVGYGGAVGLGSGIMGLGSLMAGAGAFETSTVLGAPPGVVMMVVGAAIVSVGYLVVTFTSESDFQLFISHCVWGSAYGMGTGKTKWSGVPFAQWRGRLDIQLMALTNLLSAFSIRGAGIQRLRVDVGAMHDQSRFFLEFDSWTASGSHRPILCVDVAHKRMTLAGGDPADLSRVHFCELEGRNGFEVTAAWPPGAVPAGQEYSTECTCQVYLDVNGDGEDTIPRNHVKVPYTIQDIAWGWNTYVRSSKDF